MRNLVFLMSFILLWMNGISQGVGVGIGGSPFKTIQGVSTIQFKGNPVGVYGELYTHNTDKYLGYSQSFGKTMNGVEPKILDTVIIDEYYRGYTIGISFQTKLKATESNQKTGSGRLYKFDRPLFLYFGIGRSERTTIDRINKVYKKNGTSSCSYDIKPINVYKRFAVEGLAGVDIIVTKSSSFRVMAGFNSNMGFIMNFVTILKFK